MKKNWLVYKITYRSKTKNYYIALSYERYKYRCKILGSYESRTIIKKNLTIDEAKDFRKVLTKLNK